MSDDEKLILKLARWNWRYAAIAQAVGVSLSKVKNTMAKDRAQHKAKAA